AVMMVGLKAERILQGLAMLESQTRGENRLLRLVEDYSMTNVSEKGVRIIMSYTDYINRVISKKY
ncbi:UDP-N-acetylglucosamine 2-epimerase (non-hydrolyzing), partial [Klebsiella pneumoniae]|nr:UDP-N-acetylglucosamine 2-epimerase (non-hydrolyzing) [Klebsiella pneumoniae]